MMTLAKCTVIFFGVFLIAVGFIMLFAPKKAGEILRKAGSTNLINYSEITIRMIPATALVLYAPLSKYPDFFNTLGWFMIITSLVLYFVPRQIHHGYSLRCADIIKPLYFQLISPFSMLFGATLIYCVI
ncbi:MAG: hypothetical protein IPM98_12875 [Lewinellaceae bacterium]|nr:hypothetical protein [Lewinellaceae bacterium]